jgi:hypothetical protein
MAVRPRNSNWALIVTGKKRPVNNASEKFSIFVPGSYEIRTQRVEKVVLAAV